MSLFVVPLVLGNKHLQYLMNTIPALPFTENKLLTYLLNESWYHFSPLLQYTTAAILFSILQSINRYRFYILNAYLPSEATSLKMSITFVARTMENCAPSIVPKTHKCLFACDTHLLADGIVDVCTMRREHFAILSSLGEVNF